MCYDIINLLFLNFKTIIIFRIKIYVIIDKVEIRKIMMLYIFLVKPDKWFWSIPLYMMFI